MFTSTTASTLPNISVAELHEAVQKMTEFSPLQPPIAIRISPDIPKFQISLDCPLTDDFRKEMNAWCISFFGTTNLVEDNQAYRFQDGGFTVLLVNPRTYAKLPRYAHNESIGVALGYPTQFHDPLSRDWM